MRASDFMTQPTAAKARSSPNTASTSGVGVMQKVLNSSTKGSPSVDAWRFLKESM